MGLNGTFECELFSSVADPGFGMEKFGSGIRDGKKSDPGSGRNIPGILMGLNGTLECELFSSVADPGCFFVILDPTFFHPGSPIQIFPFRIPDPHQRIKKKRF